MIYINARFLTQSITGVQRYGIELSLCLKRIEKNIKFISPHNIIQNEIAEKLEVEVIGKRTGHLWEQIDLPKYLKKKGNPILINLCNTAPIFYQNKVSVVHDIIYKLYPQSSTLLFRLFYLFLIPRVIKSSIKVITVSEFSKSEIAREFNYPLDRIYVIYNAVSKTFTPNREIQKQNYLLAVSSINYHKNYLRMIEAFRSLYIDSKPNIKLLIIGDQAQCFTEQSYNTDNIPISFAGRVSDGELVELYQNATAFIFPSLYEGFGIPPLEAQACDCPVISSNTSAMPEVLQDSCIYFNPIDVEDIKQAMLTIIKDKELQAALSKAGHINTKRFSWEQSALNLLEIIKQNK